MTKDDIQELYKKWLKQEISDEEIEQILDAGREDDLRGMVADFLEEDNLQSAYLNNRADRVAERVRASILSQIADTSNTKVKPFYKRYFKYVAAACVLLFAGIAYWNWKNSNEQFGESAQISRQVDDVKPGGNAAVLLLEGGEEIVLNPEKSALVMDNNTIRYQDGTQITASDNKVLMQTIRVPKGGEYKITLVDGTTVMLNSDSELTFPSRFATDRREVKLRGEGYFEVEKAYLPNQQRKPFLVHTDKQVIEVLGTKFNVSAYPEDRVERTTLAEGKVSVWALENDKKQILLPNQQATWNGRTLSVEKADLDVALAWTKGEFYFQDADIVQIMRHLERWYDIAVVFNGEVKGSFGGKISKDRNLSEVIEMLGATKVINCKIVGRRLYVTN